MSRKLTPWFILGFILGLQSAAWALGLGDIQLMSKLNEPLRARIPMVSVGDLNQEQILAKIASMEDFERAGIDYNFQLNQIQFKPVIRDDGSAYLELTTKTPLKEPLLDLLVDVSWPTGRIQREYAILLDPPTFSEQPTAQLEMPAGQITNTTYSSSATASSWRGETSAEYGPVNRNDTLWKIAKRVRPSSRVSIHQTMVALYHANPDAFAGDNMNNLLTGKVLKVPSASDIAAIDEQTALMEIVRHNQAWAKAGHARPASRPIGGVDVGQYAAQTRQPHAEARLKLDAPNDKDGAALAETEEALATLKAENESLKAQIEKANARLEKLEKLLALKDQELAQLTAERAEQSSDESTTRQETAASDNTKSPTGSDLSSNLTASESEPSDAFTEQLPEKPVAAEAKSNDQPSESTPSSAKQKTTVSPQTTPSEDWTQVFTQYWALWLGGVAVVIIAVFGILLMRRRAAEDALSASQSITSDEHHTHDITDDVDEALDTLSADDLLASEETDYIPEEAVDALQDEGGEEASDPIGEADVYMAYGKFDQARQVLKRALDAEPDRVDLHLKLMECLAEMKAKDEFDAHREALRSVMLTDKVVEEKVHELESKAWPDEFEGTPAQQAPDQFDDDIFGDLAFASEDVESDELTDGEEADDSGEVEDAVSEMAPVASDDTDLEWSLDDTELTLDSEPEEDEEALKTETDGVQPSELDFESDDAKAEAELEDVTLGELGAEDGFELDLEDDTVPDESESDDADLDLGDVDEVSTKLDLARAYLDMEDYDGAREILNEVLEEGNEAQKEEAQKMLAQI